MNVFVSLPKNGEVMNTFLTENVREYLESNFNVGYWGEERQPTKEEFSSAIRGYNAVITGWAHPSINFDMVKGSGLKLIAHTGGTVANLVNLDLYDNGIRVISGNKLYGESVAEGTLAYILSGLRRLPYYAQRVRNGEWRTPDDIWEGLLDRTVGIVGFGTISKILIEMLQTFRVKIKLYSAYPVDKNFLEKNNAEQTTLEKTMSCKVVSVHSALNEHTRGMIGKKEFDCLPEGALFVNTSRGRVIVENELIEELKKNRFNAVLDVYNNEPLPDDSPLRILENVWCIPHMAGPTLDRRPMIAKGVAENIRKFADGKTMELEISKEYVKRMTKV